MGKESRLSFRISHLLSEKIDAKIEETDEIRDRSDFGTKAIKFYLDYIENTESEEVLIVNALLSLAEMVDIDDEIIEALQEIASSLSPIPTNFPSKDPKSHEDYEKLLGVVNRYREAGFEEYNEIKTILNDLQYHEVPEIYEEYKEKFFVINR